jgi:hypothetical protein
MKLILIFPIIFSIFKIVNSLLQPKDIITLCPAKYLLVTDKNGAEYFEHLNGLYVYRVPVDVTDIIESPKNMSNEESEIFKVLKSSLFNYESLNHTQKLRFKLISFLF